MSDAVGRLLQNVVNLERIANSVTAESQARVQELFRQIAEDLARIDITGVSASSYQSARLDKFLALLKERLKDYQGAEATALKDRLAVIGRYQAKQVEGSLVATITEVGGRAVAFTPITQSRVRTILNTDPFQGRLLSEHIERLGANAAVKVRDQVRMGMVRQESVSDLVRRVRGKMVGYRVVDGAKRPNFEGGVIDTTTREAEALVRTAVTYVSNAGAQATFEENQKYLSGVEFTATLDDRTTLLCFPASTIVRWRGRLQNVVRSEYVGEMVIITTASGKELEGTPNHPVLTTDGLLPMNELEPGKHVVYSVPDEGPEVLEREHVGVPSRIGTLYDALDDPARTHVLRKRASPADFYGDGVGMDAEIRILVPKGHLRNGVESRCLQAAEHELLGGVHLARALNTDSARHPLLWRRGPGLQSAQFATMAAEHGPYPLRRPVADDSRDLRRPNLAIEQFQRAIDIGAEEHVGLSSREARHYPRALEEGRHRARGDAEAPADRCRALSRAIRPDYVVGVRREFRHCHVFTLQVDGGLYMAGGVVVRNCASLDGTVWPVGSPDIVVPARDTHWSCRSILMPVVDWSALGLEPPPEPPRVARNLKGVSEDDLQRRVSARRRTGDLGTVEKVSSATKAEDWLRRQPQRVQDKMLGKGRAALWRDGKYTLADLIKRDNTTVPLHELTAN